MAVSINSKSFLVGVLTIGAFLFGLLSAPLIFGNPLNTNYIGALLYADFLYSKKPRLWGSRLPIRLIWTLMESRGPGRL